MVQRKWEVGPFWSHTYPMESEPPVAQKKRTTKRSLGPETSPELDALVREIIERVADKWTMLVIEALAEHGTLRFTEVGEKIGGISQKMLTKTLRQMEADGLVTRTVLPVIPPHVEYDLTDMGFSLGKAFCGVWIWAEKNQKAIEKSRAEFQKRLDARPKPRAL